MNNTKLWSLLVSGVAMVALSGCQGDDRLKEVSALETEAQIQREKEFTESKAKEMEEDLTQRQRFYQAVSGTYIGKISAENIDYNIEITLVPSKYPYAAHRSRQLEEIASDINGLYFHAQIIQWNPKVPMSAVGCTVSNISPDIENGEIKIPSSEKCPNFYGLQITEATANLLGSKSEFRAQSRALSAFIVKGSLDQVSTIRGYMKPSTYAAEYTFSVERKAD